MINIFDILGGISLIIMYIIFASEKSFNPKIKIYGHVFAIIGGVMYIIYGFLVNGIGLIGVSIIAIIISIYGIRNSIKKNRKSL